MTAWSIQWKGHSARSRDSFRFSGIMMLLDTVLKLHSLVFKMTAFVSFTKISFKIVVLEMYILQ